MMTFATYWCRLGAVGMLAAILLFAGGGAQAAEELVLTGTENDGYGRLVFAWPDTGLPADPTQPDTRLPAYETLVSAGVLVVTFDRPFDIDADELLRRMPRYLALIRSDADGKTVRLAMKADFKLHTREAGHELYVDLLPPSWTGTPPPLPQATIARLAAEKAERERLLALVEERGKGALEIEENPPSLALRIGKRPGSTRLAFEWDRPVLYSTDFRDNRITITFDQIADLGLASLRVDPPPFVLSARSSKSDGRLTVFIDTKPGVKVRDFREDLSIVLDISPVRRDGPAPMASSAPTPLLPVPTETARRPVETPEEVRALEAQAAAAAEAAGEEAPVLANRPEPAAENDPEGTAEADGEMADAAPAADETAEAEATPSGEATSAPRDLMADAEMAPHEGPEAASFDTDIADEGVNNPAGPDEIDEAALPVFAEAVGRSVRLTFPWTSAVDAAVFQREGRVWMVFDRETAFDLSHMSPLVLERLGDPQTMELERASVLQFTPPNRLLLTASEKGSEWIVTLGDVIVEPAGPVNVSRAWNANGDSQVKFDLQDAGRIHWVRDPVVQDAIAIVTASGPPRGLLSERSFVEFQALSTAQGLALVSRADDLYVRQDGDGIAVSRGSGLTLSAADGPGYSSVRENTTDPSAPAQMDFERWRYSPGENFIERKQSHQMAVAMASGAEAADARIRYAKFLLSYRLGAEAFAMLDAALKDAEGLEQDPGFYALRGVAQIMMARNEDAVADLSIPSLEDDPHAALWRGVAQAELADWLAARRSFERAEQAFAFYAADLQALFRVKAAEAALATGDLGSAEFNLDRLPPDLADTRWQDQAALTRARLLKATGRIDEALEIYDRLVGSDHRSISARARFAHASLRHQLGALDDAQFIEELEALRLAWRGDDLELAVLQRLGELRIANGEIAEGLKVWRTAAGVFPNTERGRRIASQMTETFANLFLGGGADDMDPVEALTIYYNYRELTPIGRRGDALIRNLADRLVEVDLLDKAAALLRHQVENRLRGTARSQVAAKLALIELMNHEPEKALQAIRSTKQVRLPEELAHKRRLLEARALADMTLYDHALDLLSEMEGEGVEDLKADIYWDSQQWDLAAAAFDQALGERWRDPLELSAAERFQIMRAAIAYSLADDAAGLEGIRAKYSDLMRNSVDAASFAVVTDPIEMQGVAFRDLARSVASIDTLDSFIEKMGDSFTEPVDDAETAIN
ncbi:MAG: tetratricopeptide repeat protein [Parvibaculaceae bacterium]